MSCESKDKLDLHENSNNESNNEENDKISKLDCQNPSDHIFLSEAEKNLASIAVIDSLTLEHLKNDDDIKQPNRNKIEIKRSNSDESLFQEKRKAKSSIRFSIVNDLNENQNINVRRKSLVPSEGFVMSDEVNKAKRLSIGESQNQNQSSPNDDSNVEINRNKIISEELVINEHEASSKDESSQSNIKYSIVLVSKIFLMFFLIIYL